MRLSSALPNLARDQQCRHIQLDPGFPPACGFETLHRIVPFDAVNLTLYLPERDTFRIPALEALSAPCMYGQEIGRGNSSVGWVFDHKGYVLRRDLASQGDYENERRLLGITGTEFVVAFAAGHSGIAGGFAFISSANL